MGTYLIILLLDILAGLLLYKWMPESRVVRIFFGGIVGMFIIQWIFGILSAFLIFAPIYYIFPSLMENENSYWLIIILIFVFGFIIGEVKKKFKK